jgi:UDP-GlcNAc:undecaprenyl-phosphate GlcNAc-1-phosphate transferase
MLSGGVPPLDSPSAFFSTQFLTTAAGNLLPALFPFLLACATTIVLVPVGILAGRRLGIVAQPGGRHIHAMPTPKLGGIALYAGFAFAVAVYVPFDRQAAGLMLVAGLAAAIFVLDDRYQMPATMKLTAEVALALLAMLAFGYAITYLTLPAGGVIHIGLLALPLTLLWLLGMQNTVNLLDGVDGLAAGVVGIVAVVLAIAAVTRQQYQVTLMAFALAGACLGFLAFNFHPAGIFMGDSGSQFLGLALGLLSILGVAKVAVAFALVVPLLALAVPILDTAWAIVRRRRQRLSIAHADTRHIHHQLLDFGLDQRQTCLVFYGATGILGALGLMIFGHKRILAVAIVIVIVGLSTVLGEWLEGQPWRLPAPGLRRLLAAGESDVAAS